MATDLTQECIKGYRNADKTDWRDNAPANPFLWSSDSWLAFEAGEHMGRNGLTVPARVTKSRGYSVKVRTIGGTDFLYRATGDNLSDRELIRL